jgi:hypothetical protein
MSAIQEIGGHPSILAYRDHLKMPPLKITVCGSCERLRTILFFSKDRWLCTSCREEGDARPTQIPLRRPR